MQNAKLVQPSNRRLNQLGSEMKREET